MCQGRWYMMLMVYGHPTIRDYLNRYINPDKGLMTILQSLLVKIPISAPIYHVIALSSFSKKGRDMLT